jgi:prepilin-type N-terminal cleavage/methylation domain-containing protein
VIHLRTLDLKPQKRISFLSRSIRNLKSKIRNGFTLLEMLTTVAVLVIVLGLMVDLAGYVRNRSATDLARQLLTNLDSVMRIYHDRYQAYPPVHPFTASADLSEDEETLLRNARQNNHDFVAAMSAAGLLTPDKVNGLSATFFDGTSLHDAWDMPIVFMPASHGKIGMAPGGRGFFFSAGPDRQYKRREDNVYSYEVSRATE